MGKVGRDAARTFLRGFERSRIAVIRPTDEDERHAREIVYRYLDKDFSLTDALSFAVMRRLHIATAFSFDSDFRQFGFATATP